jgi:AcrR family transcriptional regulator
MPVRKRKTQQERSSETRRRLLDATAECLLRYGYTRTTTVQVSKLAGVSRGAQLHHFPKKAELVRAAVEYLFDRRVAEFRRAMGSIPSGRDRIAAAIDLLWEAVSDKRSFYPVLEVWVAARTDPELRDLVSGMTLKMRKTIQQTFEELFAEEAKDNPFAAIAPRFAITLMDGMAMQQLTGLDEQSIQPMLGALKLIAQLVELSRPSQDVSTQGVDK